MHQECDICHYWYILDKGFKFQLHVCNGCYDVLMSMNFRDIASLNLNGVDYRHIISRISKSIAINSMQNIDLTERNGTL